MIPHFTAIDFVSLYLEIPVMVVMYVGWMLIRRPEPNLPMSSSGTPVPTTRRKWWTSDLVDINIVDLHRDEYHEEQVDQLDDKREMRARGKARWLWKAYYWVV